MRFSTCSTEISLSISPSTFSSRSVTMGVSRISLLVGNLDREMRSDGVGELGVVLDLLDHADDFRRHLLVELHIAFELVDDRARHRFGLDLIAGGIRDDDRFGLVIFLAIGVLLDLGARGAFDQHLHGAVGQLEELQHARERADVIDGVRRRIVVGGVLLCRQQNERVRAHHLFERLDRLLAADEQRNDHVREHDDVPQRQHRIGPAFAGHQSGGFGLVALVMAPFPYCCAPPPTTRSMRCRNGLPCGREGDRGRWSVRTPRAEMKPCPEYFATFG
jgi:hypothetical protein